MADSSSRKLAALLHADVVDSTALARLDETLAHERILDTFRRLSGIVALHDGATCEIRGDALIAEFGKASDAVSAAVDFQRANAVNIGEMEDEVCPIVRIGIAIGEVVIADNTVTGEGIVLAQRLEQLADPGGVCIQGAAYETVPKRLPFEFKNLGECELKGFDEPVRVYAVRSISDSPTTRPETAAQPESDTLDIPESPIVAVLPFTNLRGDPEREYFCDGITEDIITDLCRFRSLNVIARNSTFSFKGQSVKPQDVAEELGATFVVEGSVRKAGARVRVTAQLINAHSGTHVWAERYDRELADIFEVQDEISQSVVATVATRLHESEALIASKKRPDNLNAYDYFLRGLQNYNTSDEQKLIEAKRMFSKAIEIAPEYARAHAYLALSIFIQVFYAYTGTEEVEIGLKAASRACVLDNNEPLAHAARGLILFTMRQDKQAIASLKTALSQNPNDPQISQGLGFVLTYAGYPEEGCSNLMMARRLNPRADDTPLGISLYLSGRYDHAAEILSGKQRWGALYLAAANAQLGNREEARTAFQRFIDSMQAEARLRGEPEPDSKQILSLEFTDLRRESDRTHLIDGLRKAELNEHQWTENVL